MLSYKLNKIVLSLLLIVMIKSFDSVRLDLDPNAPSACKMLQKLNDDILKICPGTNCFRSGNRPKFSNNKINLAYDAADLLKEHNFGEAIERFYMNIAETLIKAPHLSIIEGLKTWYRDPKDIVDKLTYCLIKGQLEKINLVKIINSISDCYKLAELHFAIFDIEAQRFNAPPTTLPQNSSSSSSSSQEPVSSPIQEEFLSEEHSAIKNMIENAYSSKDCLTYLNAILSKKYPPIEQHKINIKLHILQNLKEQLNNQNKTISNEFDEVISIITYVYEYLNLCSFLMDIANDLIRNAPNNLETVSSAKRIVLGYIIDGVNLARREATPQETTPQEAAKMKKKSTRQRKKAREIAKAEKQQNAAMVIQSTYRKYKTIQKAIEDQRKLELDLSKKEKEELEEQIRELTEKLKKLKAIHEEKYGVEEPEGEDINSEPEAED